MAGLDASEPNRTPMEDSPYPEDVLAEIIDKFAELEVTRSDWLPLRLVNSMSHNFWLDWMVSSLPQ